MTDLFSSYQLINARSIVRENIRPDRIDRDLTSLIKVLTPLRYMSNVGVSQGTSLTRSIVQNLDAKFDVIDLLTFFGYERNGRGDYIYRSSRSSHEREKRENGVKEFQRLFQDLRKAKNGNLYDFGNFIQNDNSNRNSYSSDEDESDDESFPTAHEVTNGNEDTLNLIRSLKESLQTGFVPSPSFIRRKLALLTFRCKYPESWNVDDNSVDETVYQKILSLKQKHTQVDVPQTDHVYTECLIRANFNENKALEILQHNRPNLEVRTEPIAAENSTRTSIEHAVEPLKQHYRLVNQTNNQERKFTRQLSGGNGKWENVKHIIPAIQKLRQQSRGAKAGEDTFTKMCRMLYSELLPIVGAQSALKLDLFARQVCDSPAEEIKNLDVSTMKNIFTSGIDDNFIHNTKNLLALDCPICFESFPRSQLESMFLCEHQFCLTCVKSYYRTNIDHIQDAHSLTILTCCEERHPIDNDKHHLFFILLEAKINQWFADEPALREKYHDKVLNAARGKQIKKCGNLKCVSSVYVDENAPVARVRCPHCTFAQCAQCCRKWYDAHTGMNCDAYLDWLVDNDEDDPDVQALRYLSKTAVVCPNNECRAIFQYRAGGCEHFSCPHCGTDFCRMCLALFYCMKKNPIKCPKANCTLKDMHAHCCPNCFRETRIGTIEAIVKLLNDNGIDVAVELRVNPVSTDKKCPVEDCGKPTSAICEDRFCEGCYKQFLCTIIWNHQIRPWEIYENNNLQQMLVKASVPIPANVTRQNLIALCETHLNASLGQPKKLVKPKKN